MSGGEKAENNSNAGAEAVRSKLTEDGEDSEMDKDFDPSVDMLVHAFDDEATMDEEESLQPLQDQLVELADLEREGSMPIEELLAMYGYNGSASDFASLGESFLIPEGNSGTGMQLLQSNSASDGEDDDEDDENEVATTSRYGGFNEDIPVTRSVRVGEEYQAVVPEGLSKYDDFPPYENDDKQLWDPNKLPESLITQYTSQVKELKSIQQKKVDDIAAPPALKKRKVKIEQMHEFRDDEQSLYLLLQCGFNIDEALRRQRLNVVPQSNMSLWSEEECEHFECGLCLYRKDFYKIQKTEVRTRSLVELIQFYYTWKKTERHDVFLATHRLQKKKSDGTADEDDSNGSGVDITSSGEDANAVESGEYMFNSGPGGNRLAPYRSAEVEFKCTSHKPRVWPDSIPTTTFAASSENSESNQ